VDRIPLNDLRRQHDVIGPALDAALLRVAASGWYVLGPENEAFESELAAYCGTTGAVGVASGTDALELAMRAVGVRPGDEVITTATAGGYAALACAAIGACPVWVDSRSSTLGIDPERIAEAITARTRAVVVTHLYGIVTDVAALRAALPGGVAIVEDCAQAHGARLGGLRVGALGDAGAFSFYPTKNLGALGDGGAVVSNRDDVLSGVRTLRQYGWDTRNDAIVAGGRNSRLDEVQAAVLRVKLPRLDADNDRRRAIAGRWRLGLEGSVVPVAAGDGEDPADDVAHLCVVRVRERDAVRAALDAAGIATGVHFGVPDHHQRALAAVGRAAGPLPVTERSAGEVLSLPCFPELRDDELDTAVDRAVTVLGARA